MWTELLAIQEQLSMGFLPVPWDRPFWPRSSSALNSLNYFVAVMFGAVRPRC